jgi:hypothetical protein
MTERPASQVAAVEIQQVDEERGRGDGVRVRLTQPVESGPELAS